MDVVHYLLHILRNRPALGIQFEGKYVVESALRAFYLGTEYRLLSDVHGNEEVRIGQGQGNTIQACNGLIRSGEQPNKRGV